MTQFPIMLLQQMTVSAQLAIAVIGIVGAGLSSWIGVKVALAQVLTNQQNMKEAIAEIRQTHKECQAETNRRLDRLESKYFHA